MPRARKRIEWIDALRGFTILLVLLGHNNPPFVKYIYGFHMPLFFIVSGYLYKESDEVIKHILHVAKKLLLGYIGLWVVNTIIYHIVVKMVVKDYVIDWNQVFQNFIDILQIKSSGMQGCFTLWFLPVLGLTEILFVLIRSIKNLILRASAIIVIVVTGFALPAMGIDAPFRLSTIFVCILFMEMGFCIRKHYLVQMARDTIPRVAKAIIAISATVIGYFAIRYNLPEHKVDISLAVYGNVFLFIVGAIAWTVTSFSIVAIFRKVRILNFMDAILSRIGRHTLFIMSFDESTNLVGGTTIDKMKWEHSWYSDFGIRLVIMGLYFVIYYIFSTLFRITVNAIKKQQ